MKIGTVIKAFACSALFTLAIHPFVADSAPAGTSTPIITSDNSQALAAFEIQLQAAVEKGGYYPKEAIRNGEQGVVVVEFDYTGGGKATNVTLGATNAPDTLNRAAIRSVEKAILPPKPPELAGISHFHIKLTYTLKG